MKSDESETDESETEYETETDNEAPCSLLSDSSSSSDEEDDVNEQQHEQPQTQPQTHPRRRVRTRGGIALRPPRAEHDNTWIEGPFIPDLPTFTASPGVFVDIPDDASVLDIFQVLVPNSIFLLIVNQTNLYAHQLWEERQLPEKSRAKQWKPVTIEEMKKFVALTILMGLDEKPAIENYWAKRGVFHSHYYRAVMSRNRYQLIRKFIHFADNSKADGDRLFKVRKLINSLLERFQDSYWPSQNVAIDEQLLLHKGRLGFRQYIPIKRSRFGIKIYSLCDETRYVWNCEVYTGKVNDNNGNNNDNEI